MDYQTFLKALADAANGVLKDAKIRGKAAYLEVTNFIEELTPAAEAAFETAVRTGEKTHWNTVRMIASRVLLKTIGVADTFAAEERESIKQAVFAAIRTFAAVAITAV